MTHPRIAWLLDRVKGICVLDVGYARKQDVLLRGLRERNPQATVVGLDLDVETVLATQDPHTLVGDALRLPFPDGEFDAIVAGELLEHVWNGFDLLRELVRVLRPGGLVYLTTPNPFSPNVWFRYWFKMLWNPPSLFNAVDELGLEIVEAVTVGFRIPFVSRVVTGLGSLSVPWYPFTRLGSNLCLMGRKTYPDWLVRNEVIRYDVFYIANARLPTEKAHGVQIMKTCEGYVWYTVNHAGFCNEPGRDTVLTEGV